MTIVPCVILKGSVRSRNKCLLKIKSNVDIFCDLVSQWLPSYLTIVDKATKKMKDFDFSRDGYSLSRSSF